MNTELPQKPEPPNPQDCCESGCTNCVYTVYDEELQRWREAVKQAAEAARTAATGSGIGAGTGAGTGAGIGADAGPG